MPLIRDHGMLDWLSRDAWLTSPTASPIAMSWYFTASTARAPLARSQSDRFLNCAREHLLPEDFGAGHIHPVAEHRYEKFSQLVDGKHVGIISEVDEDVDVASMIVLASRNRPEQSRVPKARPLDCEENGPMVPAKKSAHRPKRRNIFRPCWHGNERQPLSAGSEDSFQNVGPRLGTP